ncbi:hypothetical protein Uis1B_0092 [Bifidobacterium margollesii]|uniref:galactosylceramidase n=1 Tax=Bifidobacterium margollesii TaxID=2020964 RepID=A0A2N5JCQ6_9BIFI|nr:sugar-binding protein [Bifidobacterium margollesii]PLS32000.1 hypothetical protein Uis1B_0092 [Bifidobacterium margollesii]
MTTLKPVHLTVDAETVRRAAASRHGLTYKGFGVLSGNATSSLLLDYKAEHPSEYWRLVETLFGTDRPIMNLVKVEMGNDRNNSTGPNAATMREPDEYPAVTREPGFQLAADARRYQPDLHVSMLRWHAPTWVRSNDDVYRWYKNTILAVWREYGYMVDTVNPDVNERTADLAWVAEFKRRVATDETGFIGTGPDDPNSGFHSDEERELFHRIRVITSDEEVTGTFGPDLIADADLREAIDIAAYHYSVADDDDCSFTRLADDCDKEIWNSEAQATFSNSADRPNNTMDRLRPDGHRRPSDCQADGTGTGISGSGEVGTGIGGIGSPLEMANTLIKAFVRSRRTNAIYQPAIGAFYEGLEYSYKELISARDPWSGWIYYDAGLVALQHFCRFARLGYGPEAWRALPEASVSEVGGNNPVCGARSGEPSALTMVSPDGDDVSTVIVNDSGLPREYRLDVVGVPAAGRTMRLWRTRAAGVGQPYDAEYLRYIGDVEPQGSPADVDDSAGDSAGGPAVGSDADSARSAEYAVTVEPWSMVTLTSLDVDDIPRPGIPHTDERARTVLDVDPDGRTLYEDDFEYADEPPVTVWKHGRLVEEDYLDSRGGAAGAVPRYTTDTNGAFEVVPYDDTEWGVSPATGTAGSDGAAGEVRARGPHVLRQQVDWRHAGNAWIEGDPRTSIGDMRWMNYRAGVDVMFEPYEGRAPYVLLGVREMGGNKFSTDLAAYDFKLRADGVWLLRRYGDEVRRGHGVDLALAGTGFRSGAGVWNRVEIQAADGEITVFVNGMELTRWTDPHPQTAGRVQLGTSFDHVLFDRLRVERLDTERLDADGMGRGLPAYYRELIDDMHMVSWDDSCTQVLDYAGPWTHENGRGMFDYQRTTSTALRAGARLTIDTDADGIDLFARNAAELNPVGERETARFDVTVDGEPFRRAEPTVETASALRTALTLRGLPAGGHRVTFELVGGIPFALDAVGLC